MKWELGEHSAKSAVGASASDGGAARHENGDHYSSFVVAQPPASIDWIHEIKHDGFRMLARRICSPRVSSANDPYTNALFARSPARWGPAVLQNVPQTADRARE